MRGRIHLTVNWPGGVKADHAIDDGPEGSHASKRIQLHQANVDQWKRGSEAHSGTDPYSPPVAVTPSDDTPLVVECSEKFPARNTGLS